MAFARQGRRTCRLLCSEPCVRAESKICRAANVSVSPRSRGKNRKPFVPQGQFRKWQGAGSNQNGGQGRSQRADERKCFICNRSGHIARYCVEGRPTQTTVNSLNSTEGDTAQVSRVSVCIGGPAVDCLPSAEVRKSTPSVECRRSIETDVVCNTIGVTKVANFHSQRSRSSIK